jgi:hypothetical protein
MPFRFLRGGPYGAKPIQEGILVQGRLEVTFGERLYEKGLLGK